jgi:hypothetical protein
LLGLRVGDRLRLLLVIGVGRERSTGVAVFLLLRVELHDVWRLIMKVNAVSGGRTGPFQLFQILSRFCNLLLTSLIGARFASSFITTVSNISKVLRIS